MRKWTKQMILLGEKNSKKKKFDCNLVQAKVFHIIMSLCAYIVFVYMYFMTTYTTVRIQLVLILSCFVILTGWVMCQSIQETFLIMPFPCKMDRYPASWIKALIYSGVALTRKNCVFYAKKRAGYANPKMLCVYCTQKSYLTHQNAFSLFVFYTQQRRFVEPLPWV